MSQSKIIITRKHDILLTILDYAGAFLMVEDMIIGVVLQAQAGGVVGTNPIPYWANGFVKERKWHGGNLIVLYGFLKEKSH